jgi:hypothetical protein
MKRLALVVAAIAVLASLTSCSDDSGSDDSAPETSTSESGSEEPTEEPTEEPSEESTDTPTEDAGDPARFTTAYAEVAALFTELNAQADEAQPTSTEEANAAAGLDETTPLVFADYTVLADESGGSLCLLSAGTGTYIAVSYAGGEGEVDLGDGECSYDTAAATVVGDIATDSWTVGAELMGDLVPSGILGS